MLKNSKNVDVKVDIFNDNVFKVYITFRGPPDTVYFDGIYTV